MNIRKNSQEKSILYFIPEDDTEKIILKQAWMKGSLKLRVLSFSSGGDLGVSIKSVKDYKRDDKNEDL